MHPYPTLRLTESPGFQETHLEARPTRESERYPHRPAAKRRMRRRLKRHDRRRATLEEARLALLEEQQERDEWRAEAARMRIDNEESDAWFDYKYAILDAWAYDAEGWQ